MTAPPAVRSTCFTVSTAGMPAIRRPELFCARDDFLNDLLRDKRPHRIVNQHDVIRRAEIAANALATESWRCSPPSTSCSFFCRISWPLFPAGCEIR